MTTRTDARQAHGRTTTTGSGATPGATPRARRAEPVGAQPVASAPLGPAPPASGGIRAEPLGCTPSVSRSKTPCRVPAEGETGRSRGRRRLAGLTTPRRLVPAVLATTATLALAGLAGAAAAPTDGRHTSATSGHSAAPPADSGANPAAGSVAKSSVGPAGRPAGAVTGAASAPAPAGAPASPDVVAYVDPVWGSLRVLRPFEPPPSPYSAGHRGVDLATAPDGPIRAAGPGVVTFAGSVAGRGVVAIRHPDGVTTEYEPVHPAVHRGEAVAGGDRIGAVDGTHEGCPPHGCLHWGARRGTTYLDPLTLLRPLGPVRLLPWPPVPTVTGP